MEARIRPLSETQSSKRLDVPQRSYSRSSNFSLTWMEQMKVWFRKEHRRVVEKQLKNSQPLRSDHRASFTADISRSMVVAEAKSLVKQLDNYLELIGEWTDEEGVVNGDA